MSQLNKCKICGEYDWFGNHKCEQKWYCASDSDFNENEIPDAEYMTEEGRDTYAHNAEKAAIKFAEYYQARTSWFPEEMNVFVMDIEGENILKYIVYLETVPSYSTNVEPEIFPLKGA
jgi:hypothetical protein